MKGISGWQYRPYRPAHQLDKARIPFICRMAPEAETIELEWFDTGGCDAKHTLEWRFKGSSAPWQTLMADTPKMLITGLKPDNDYELRILRKNTPVESSAVRFGRTGTTPGKIINYLHPEDEIYAFSGRSLCSPSIVKLPSGGLLASMDVFAGNAPQNLTLLFRSEDRGVNWHFVADLFPCFWGTLFVHRDRLYMLGCSTEYGDLLIGASNDEGFTWMPPVRIFSGSSSNLSAGWQRTPMPIINTQGRLYTSIDYGAWREGGHVIGTLSIKEDTDLLESSNWTCSDFTAYDPSWPGSPVGKSTGLLEGNVVLGKDGRLLNILRLQAQNCEPDHGIAVSLEIDPGNPEAAPRFYKFISLPSGSNSKSHILYDALSSQYLAMGNICVDPSFPTQRNVLALQASGDLFNWHIVKVLIDYRQENPKDVGFQYPSFIIDGDDILYLSRTSLNKAHNYHDANYSTFHIIENFRQFL